MALQITERIWLRFTPPKSSLTAGLQIRSERCAKFRSPPFRQTKDDNTDSKPKAL